MAAPDRFIAWCKQEEASIEQQLELMIAGKVRTGEDTGSGWIDTTPVSMERAIARLAELKSLLTEAGTATVSKTGIAVMKVEHIWAALFFTLGFMSLAYLAVKLLAG